MSKFKVGQRAHNNVDNYFCDILDIKESTNRAWVEQDNGEMVNVSLDDLHETADDMFVKLGYKQLDERIYSNNLYSIFFIKETKEIYTKTFLNDELTVVISTQLHLAIHQKMIELGWLK